jgi:deoxyhypusine synthase
MGNIDLKYEQMAFAEATTVIQLIVSYIYHSKVWEKLERKEWSKRYEK